MPNTSRTISLEEIQKDKNIIKKFTLNGKEPLYILNKAESLGVFLSLKYYNDILKQLDDLEDIWEIRNTIKDEAIDLEDYHKKRLKKQNESSSVKKSSKRS